VATADDVGALTELREQWTRERHGTGADPGFADRFGAWFTAEAHQRTFWLAVHDATAIGMANLLTFERMPGPGVDTGRWGYLGNMFVVPDHRNAGVGRQLLDTLVAHADARGFERIVLSPSERSVPFYRAAGFGDADELLLRPRSR
jgi:GNAT superfamily N-acetyltransferase